MSPVPLLKKIEKCYDCGEITYCCIRKIHDDVFSAIKRYHKWLLKNCEDIEIVIEFVKEFGVKGGLS